MAARLSDGHGLRMTRRSFVKGGMALGTAAALDLPLLASVVQQAASAGSQDAPLHSSLEDGWEYYQGPLDPRFQIWHSDQIVDWQPVTVPHCFNHHDGCDPDVPAYRGPGWYRRQLRVNNPFPEGRTLLHFEGAGQRAEIWVGNQLVGRHDGGYDEFLIDMTEAARHLAPGEELPLAVLCDNSRDVDRMPSDLSDFTLYGGLYRAVYLAYVPAVSLEAVHTQVDFEPGHAATVKVTARLYGTATGPLRLQVAIFDSHDRCLHEESAAREAWQGEVEVARFTLHHPELWSPLTPNLYRCEISLKSVAGEVTTAHRFGVRHTHFEEHGPFYLNGERLLLRGTHRHQDHAGCAAAMPDDLIRQEMRMIRAMGANFIRLAHYQQPRLVLDLCDELGLLVWEELPWCRSGAGTEAFRQHGREKLRTMIDQHRNHASILVWGLGNEDDWPSEFQGEDHAAIRAYMTELRDLAHQLDPSRPTAFRRCDFARDIPDVYSPSIWAGWYSGSYTEYRGALEKARERVPRFLHMEWGADSHAGRHAEDPDPVLARIATGQGTAETGFAYKMTGGGIRVSKDGEWSETYACDLFDWYLKTIDELPWLTGAAQWAFKDFTTALRGDNPIPRVNQKGLVNRDLTPKEGYFVFQSYWADQPMVHIYGHDWPVRWGRPGQERMVRVYSNCSNVELFLNGISVGTKHRDSMDFPAAGLRWNLSFREGENELRALAHSERGTVADSVRFIYQAQPWSSPARLVMSLKSRIAGVATVEAVMLDSAGIRCLDSRAVVRFSLAGDGKLQDNIGTPTGSRLVQMYNGRAQISLTHAGEVTAGVHAAGVEPAFLRIARS